MTLEREEVRQIADAMRDGLRDESTVFAEIDAFADGPAPGTREHRAQVTAARWFRDHPASSAAEEAGFDVPVEDDEERAPGPRPGAEEERFPYVAPAVTPEAVAEKIGQLRKLPQTDEMRDQIDKLRLFKTTLIVAQHMQERADLRAADREELQAAANDPDPGLELDVDYA